MQQEAPAQNPLVGKENLTLAQFSAAYAVPRTTLYGLWQQGLGPRTLRIGRRVLINRKAAEEWVARMEAETAAQHNQPVAA